MSQHTQSALPLIESGKDLSRDHAELVMSEIFNGEVATDMLVRFLGALADKGESVSEIVGFASVMRRELIPVQLGDQCLDLCGTGGSGKDRFNISTASAFILASLGVSVAKHGNRGSQKSNGSFDFLEALGVSLDQSPEQLVDQYHRFKLAFLFAKNHHPGMRFVGEARKLLGRRSIFNLLGPLCSPASVTHHVLGTIDWGVAEKLAQSLQQLGIIRAFVVVGDQGMDEFTTTGSSRYLDVTQTGIHEQTLDPADWDLDTSVDSMGGLAVENARLFQSLLNTPDLEHPVMKQLILNSAMGLLCVGHVPDIASGISLIKQGLLSNQTQAFVARFLHQ